MYKLQGHALYAKAQPRIVVFESRWLATGWVEPQVRPSSVPASFRSRPPGRLYEKSSSAGKERDGSRADPGVGPIIFVPLSTRHVEKRRRESRAEGEHPFENRHRDSFARAVRHVEDVVGEQRNVGRLTLHDLIQIDANLVLRARPCFPRSYTPRSTRMASDPA